MSSNRVGFNRDNFLEFFGDIMLANQSMAAVMEATEDARDAGVVKVMGLLEGYVHDLMEGVSVGDKKVIWHSGVLSPEIFGCFENVVPFAMEVPIFMVSFCDPDGVGEYIDVAEEIGMPSDICGTDKGTLGFALREMLPPADIVAMGTVPCDSVMCGHQVMEKLMDAPFSYLDMPEVPDERGLDMIVHHLHKMIKTVEEVCNTKLDWDKFKEVIEISNEQQEYLLLENELRRMKPCPHGGRLGTITSFLNFVGSGTEAGRDAAKFIYEDAKKLVEAGKGVVNGKERGRLMWYYPDPLYDLGIHDWLEDDFDVCTVLTMFAHATANLIDPSTPETILRGYALKMMSGAMTRQFRGPMENYMALFNDALDDYNIDSVVYPLVHQCKHSLALHGIVREACRKKDLPLLMPEYDVIDNRIVSIDNIRENVQEFLEVQVLPNS